jgi:glycosidase
LQSPDRYTFDRLPGLPLLLAWILLAIPPAVADSAAPIDRVEPPFWWVGFRDSTLQIMLHGENIARFTPSVQHPGISVLRSERVDNPNYLFLYLDIGSEARAGEFNISLNADGESFSRPYTLREKSNDPLHTQSFSPDDAIYLITPDRFANGDPGNDSIVGMGDPVDRGNPGGRHGGDIQGIADHLDYISDMGFTAIWLNPLLENRMPAFSYHGYSTTDFYRVDPRFGSNEQYRALVSSAKAKGIGVIMDMIVNHIGSGHWWMADLPAPDWLNHPENPFITSHEHVSEQDPYASDWDYRRYSDGWFDVTMPDLNQRNPLLADYLTQNALWWIEYLGLAGIRMDTYPYPDKHYMTEWTRRVMLEYPDFNVVGEEWTSNQPSVAYWQRGQQNRDGYVSYLPSLMDFPLQEAMRAALVSEEGSKMSDGSPAGLLRLYHALANDFLYADPKALVVFPDNHDMNRVFTQLGGDFGLFRMALSYMLMVRGTPQIYYGTEVLMANHDSPEHGVIRSDFPGGWPGDEVNAFSGEGLSTEQQEARDFLRTLLHWRRDQEVIHNGELMHFRPENGTYVLFRYDDRHSVMLILNKNAQQTRLDLARFGERLEGYTEAVDILSGEIQTLDQGLLLPPRAPLILELR